MYRIIFHNFHFLHVNYLSSKFYQLLLKSFYHGKKQTKSEPTPQSWQVSINELDRLYYSLSRYHLIFLCILYLHCPKLHYSQYSFFNFLLQPQAKKKFETRLQIQILVSFGYRIRQTVLQSISVPSHFFVNASSSLSKLMLLSTLFFSNFVLQAQTKKKFKTRLQIRI